MKFRFFSKSDKIWRAMLDEINKAKTSIYLEMYIMLDDTSGYNFVSALKHKAENGVKVVLILDAFGSYSLSSKAQDLLQKAGVEIIFSSHLLHRLHRKILIIDESVAFIGGANIHKSSIHWRDLTLKTSGKRAVKIMLRSFAKTYVRCGGNNKYLFSISNKNFSEKDSGIRMFNHSPLRKKNAIKNYYIKKISQAKNSITFVTPYFVPGRWLLSLLDLASFRGVKIEVLIPRKSDSWFMDRANEYNAAYISKNGTKVFLMPHMNHSKIILTDEREAMVSSSNLDSMSFEYNFESGVAFDNAQMISDISKIITEWKEESVMFDSSVQKIKWYDKASSVLMYLARPFL